ncbi:MAG: DEAD/DEAH box helicase [Chloroflexi bacterium]|nr:DEAD/DEAH box helicase [Chloroflexota bacterium]
MGDFLSMGLNPRVLRAVAAMGFEEPTPVQQQTIPRLLQGVDLVVQAQTGTGKTAAYGIPLAQRVKAGDPHVQALVLAPTRELTLQVAEQLAQLTQFLGVYVLPVYGGQSYDHQIRSLRRGVQIVVATPGRLLDLMDKRVLSLEQARFVVLDEADEMLDMGFQEDVERILSRTPQERQTSLFSATMPDPILRLATRYLSQPERIILSQPRALTVPTVSQSYFLMHLQFKVEALTRILDTRAPELALVFCATKRMVADLGRELQGRGYHAEALHGDMTQGQREAVMQATRAGQVEVLVATDVAARGLDIPEVSHVINFDIPQESDSYVHRIGRTARAGRAGEAITLVTPRELSLLRAIESALGTPIRHEPLPAVAELEERERQGMAAHLRQVLLEGQWADFRPLVEGLSEQHDPLDIAAAAVSLAYGPARLRPEIPQITPAEVAPTRATYAPRRRFGRGRRR